MVHDPILQHHPDLFQNWKWCTQSTILNLAVLLLEQRLSFFHGILQSWRHLLLCCELWRLTGLSTDIRTLRDHYFFTMWAGSVKTLWWSSCISHTLLGKTAEHRGVGKVLEKFSIVIWTNHHNHYLLQHSCFLHYFLSITGIYNNIFKQAQQLGQHSIES